MSPNSNRVLNLEPVRLRPLALRITSVVTACTLLITTLLPAMLTAQPVPVNPIAPQTFQGQDFDPFFNSALGSATQGQWESLIDQGKYLLAAQWEADIDAQIAQEVAAVTQSDHFNSVAEYQDYLRSEYELQKQTAYAGWEIAAEARIEAERVAFLQALSEKERLAAEQDSDAAIDAGIAVGAAGLAFAAGSFISIVVRLSVGVMADRRPGNLLGVVAAMIALGSLTSVWFTWREPAVHLIGVPLAFGAGWAWPGLFNLSVVRACPGFPGRATGITQTGTYVGGAVGPVLLGAVAESADYSSAWWLAAVLGLGASTSVLVGRAILSGRLADRALRSSDPRRPSTRP